MFRFDAKNEKEEFASVNCPVEVLMLKHELEDFANCCLSYIDKNADALLKSEAFLQIDQRTLCEIIGRDELQIHEEISIWKARIASNAWPGTFQNTFSAGLN
ncbi:hypothetical protein niasHT_033799 [Heterodera trifolii]|uniref:BACK domain-containing protein n=1 Tax=Heterodera trifolii TaxID=157864 RepID=A0ABD2J7C2_9BILA